MTPVIAAESVGIGVPGMSVPLFTRITFSNHTVRNVVVRATRKEASRQKELAFYTHQLSLISFRKSIRRRKCQGIGKRIAAIQYRELKRAAIIHDFEQIAEFVQLTSDE